MNSTRSKEQVSRIIYFDYLRVFATFAVIILHISAQNWSTTDVKSFEWQVFNFFDSIVRWCVPLFVMISGALFLNRNIQIKEIYCKYILRMVTSFFVWSFIYAIFTDEDIISHLFTGHYHMWFILMIIGVYMCVPLIKPIVDNDKRIKYYFFLSFVFAFILPEAKILVNDFGNMLFIKGAQIINGIVNKMNMHYVLGYVSYFILGYYINRKGLCKQKRIIIYILGIIGFTFTIIMDLIVALKTQSCCSHYYDYFTVNVLFESIAVFTWFKHKKYNRHKLNVIMQKLSKYSFGAYLVHLLIIEQLNSKFNLNTLSFNSILAVICIGVLVFTVSFTISAILNKIPIIRKYIV